MKLNLGRLVEEAEQEWADTKGQMNVKWNDKVSKLTRKKLNDLAERYKYYIIANNL